MGIIRRNFIKVACRFFHDDKPYFVHSAVKSELFYILEGKKDNRIPAKMFGKRLCFSDGKAVKQGCRLGLSVLILMSFKKTAQHGKVQGLAETPGAGQEQYFSAGVDHFLGQHRLVNIDKIPCPEFPELADSYAYFFIHCANRLSIYALSDFSLSA